MGKFDEFLATVDNKSAKPDGIEWFASVRCQICGETVSQQTLYPTEAALIWWCTAGHRSYLEGYRAFG